MIFYIIVGLAVVALIIAIIRDVYHRRGHRYYSYDSPVVLGWGIVAVVVLGLILWFLGFATSFQGGSATGTLVKEEKSNLQALTTRESSASRFYLSAGYSNGEPGFNYLYQDKDGGAIRMNFARNWQSEVYADEADQPYVVTQHFLFYNHIYVPWPVNNVLNYDFHVPENAVSSEIVVTP